MAILSMMSTVNEGFRGSVEALTALDNVQHFVGLLSPQGVVLEANRAALDAGGLLRAHVVGRPIWETAWWSHSEEARDRLRAAVQRASGGESVAYAESVLAGAGGSELIELDFRLTPVRDDHGRVIHLVPEGHPRGPAGALDGGEDSWRELVSQPAQERSEVQALRALATGRATARTVDEVAEVAAARVADALGLSFTNVALRTEDDPAARLFHRSTLDAEIASRWLEVPIDADTVLGRALLTGRTVVAADLKELAREFPSMLDDARRAGLTGLAAVPVWRRDGRFDAAIGIGWADAPAPDLAAAAAVFDLCGAAFERSWLSTETDRLASFLAQLLQEAPIGIAFLDSDLRFRLVNDRLADMNGVPAFEHLGRRIDEVVPGLSSEATSTPRAVLTSGHRRTGIEVIGETPASPGEQRIWQEAFYPVTDGAGKPLGVGAVVVDVTDQRRSTLELERTAKSLQLATRVSNSGVYRWNPTTGETSWTSEYADLYGFEETQAPSFDAWIERVRPEDRAKLTERTERLLAGDDDWHLEFRIDHPTRGTRWLESRVHADRRDDGSIALVTGINTDITERKHRELELAELNERHAQVARRLQSGLLPPGAPRVPGYSFATRYRPASDGLSVGGDWYDVMEIAHDDIAIVVGDVVGHDLDAAITMGALRNVLIGLSHARRDPAAVLEGLDEYATHEPSVLASTVFYGRLDVATGMLRWTSAGHPPCLLIPAAGSASYLEAQGPPIGCAQRRTHTSTRLDPGDALIAYTDGLVERRGEQIDAGLERLRDVVAVADRSTLDGFVDHVLSHAVDQQADDIALLALARR